ncbi:MAG TPA: condensation domain-containing protein, partial [Ktedonobacteraceae bacterium]|nr:condensation domain-containing protein [Ktedonobacteraceae bacterium]
ERSILPWSAYTNNPLQEHFQQKMIPGLRDYLKAKLPEYMIPSAFVILQALPLTPNGKVDRRALPSPGHTRSGLKKEYIAPRTQVEEELASIWQQVLGIERVGIYDNFFDLGGNSLLIIRMVAKANKAGLVITTKQVFKYQTIAELATAVGTASLLTEQGLVVGPTPSTPGQRFVLAPSVIRPQYSNLAFFVHFHQGIIPTRLRQVVQEMFLYHDALRLHLAPENTDLPLYTAAPFADLPFLRVNLSRLTDEEEWDAVFGTLRTLQMSLNMHVGPLFKVVLFERGAAQPADVLLLGHYLLADIESWQVLLGDLVAGYRQLSERGSISYPAKPTSFQQWAKRLNEYAQSPAAAQELSYWLAEVQRGTASLPRDYSGGVNTIDSSETVELDLSVEETNILMHEVLKYYDAQMDAVLMMAIAWAFGQWIGKRSLLARLFSHGREPLFEDMDVSRTVGSFATDFPVHIDVSSARNEADALQMVKAHLKEIPHHGINYGILRELGKSAEAETLRAMPEAEVVVNYIGEGASDVPRTDYEVNGPYSGHYLDVQADRTYTFQVTGRILEGKVHIQWDFSKQLHRRSTVESIANNVLGALQALITRYQAQRSSS